MMNYESVICVRNVFDANRVTKRTYPIRVDYRVQQNNVFIS